MIPNDFHHGSSAPPPAGLDPRARVVVAFTFSLVVALSHRPAVLLTALAFGFLTAAAARLAPLPLLKRLTLLNGFMAFLFLCLPPAVPGNEVFRLGSVPFSDAGLLQAAAITLKSNAIVLALTALIGTIEIVALGHALSHLRVPDKLTFLFLFTVRYIAVLRGEHLRLRNAMKIRGFRPRMDRRTYRALGQLIGMLLVMSFDRAERILAAMKCRGFHGRFYVLDHFHFHRRDSLFTALSLLICGLLAWAEWL